MHQRTLMLILSLFLLHLTSKCWAQEPTPTTETPSATLGFPSGNIIDETITNKPSDPTTPASPEVPTTTPETPEAPTTTPETPEAPTTIPEVPPDVPPDVPSPVLPVTSDPPAPSDRPFVVKVSAPIIEECKEITIKWVGTDLIPPFRVLYAKGTGEMGDDSIMDVDIQLVYTGIDQYTWLVPPNSLAPPGNVTRITVMENWGMGGRSAITWLPWKAGHLDQCPNDPALTETSVSTQSTEAVTRQTTEHLITSWAPAPIGSTELAPPNQVPRPSEASQLITVVVTLPSEPTATVPSNQDNAPINGSPITAAPIMNRPTTAADNNLIRPPASGVVNPQGSGGSNSQSSNGSNPQGSNGSNPQPSNGSNSQPSNGSNGVTEVEVLRTIMVAVGESSTITIVTRIPQGVTGSIVLAQQSQQPQQSQQSTVPVTTPYSGQKNSTARGELPPAAIGAIVGTLLGAITLWILLLIWLKRRKKARNPKDQEDPRVVFSPTEDIRVTPFQPLASEPHYLLKSKQRVMEEVIRPMSPVTSIADTGSQSQLLTVPITQSEELDSVASTSDPFRTPSRSIKKQKSMI